jgi:hypothetical protein
MSDAKLGSAEAQHVFLSHGPTDEGLVETLRRSLEHEGFEVWSDQALSPGDLWAKSIGSALKEADSFVFLVGRNDAESTWASIELGQALASGKKVVPIVTEPNAEIPAMLRGYQFLDLSDRQALDAGVSKLVEALRRPSGGGVPGEGIRFLEEASHSLTRAQVAHEQHIQERMASVARMQAGLAIVAVLVTGITLILSGAGGDVGGSIAVGLLTVAVAMVGFQVGRREQKGRDDD